MSARHRKPRMPSREGWQFVHSDGAGPFVSRIVHRMPDGSLRTWISRQHRKGCGLQRSGRAATVGTEKRRRPWFTVWESARLGWWIAVLFMVGSACFAMAFQNVTVVNAVFFAGSIFFTAASYLQLLEVTNTNRRAALARGETPQERFRWFTWQPGQVGWLSTFIQFVGTIFFNVTTLNAMLPDLDWLQQDLLVWTPDILGSICFLVSSWLAVLEFSHGYWCWQLRNVSWWIIIVNLLGSIAFMVSAVFAVVLPASANLLDVWIVNLSTFIGAVCFLIGAYLMHPEMASYRSLIPTEEH